MAHFAKLNEKNFVEQIIVIKNDEILVDGEESEQMGVDFCVAHFGGRWKQTSYNGNFRKNFAGIGYQYDEIRDAFIPPKPSDDAILNDETCRWEIA